jgi:urease accessory protein
VYHIEFKSRQAVVLAAKENVMKRFFIKLMTVMSAGLISSLAIAHPGHEGTVISTGVLSGALHPLLGLDHLLSLIAVGILSTRLQGKQKYLVPLCFVGLMLAGFVFAHAGLHLISVATMESMILVSLGMAAMFMLLGQVLQNNTRFHEVSAWCMTAFASIHGMAHGLEIPAGASALGFAAGFSLMCLLVMGLVLWIAHSFKTLVSQPTI